MQKRPIILRSLLIVATPYLTSQIHVHVYVCVCVCVYVCAYSEKYLSTNKISHNPPPLPPHTSAHIHACTYAYTHTNIHMHLQTQKSTTSLPEQANEVQTQHHRIQRNQIRRIVSKIVTDSCVWHDSVPTRARAQGTKKINKIKENSKENSN